MPNYILCDQFHERISVLVHTCTVSSNVKGILVQNVMVRKSFALFLIAWVCSYIVL